MTLVRFFTIKKIKQQFYSNLRQSVVTNRSVFLLLTIRSYALLWSITLCFIHICFRRIYDLATDQHASRSVFKATEVLMDYLKILIRNTLPLKYFTVIVSLFPWRVLSAKQQFRAIFFTI